MNGSGFAAIPAPAAARFFDDYPEENNGS